jgi:hypothetical protein
MGEKANTISGFCTLETVHNFHKKPGRGCFPPFGGGFWPCDSGGWCRIRALFFGRSFRGAAGPNNYSSYLPTGFRLNHPRAKSNTIPHPPTRYSPLKSAPSIYYLPVSLGHSASSTSLKSPSRTGWRPLLIYGFQVSRVKLSQA